MIGKIMTPKSNKAEGLVKSVFERFSFVNLEDDDLIRNPRIYVPDFVFEFEKNKYCVVVKIQFSTYSVGYILEDFYKLLKKEKKFGIIVILDKVPKEYKRLIKEEYNIDIYDISNILYLIHDDENLQNEFNSIIDFPLDSITPQEVDIKINAKKIIEKIQNVEDDYIEQLSNIKAGREDAKKYEQLLEKIIKKVFSNELMLFRTQSRTEDGLNIFDMICKIKNGLTDDFFSIIEKFYGTKYVLFELKNYESVIKQGQICTTEKYLFEAALRKVAIIITRHGIDENGKKLANGILRESGKLIIVLDDNDVKEMFRLYRRGEKATYVLTKKLDEILTTLEK